MRFDIPLCLSQITVTDHGVPARSTTVRVIVKVLDENDNRPLFLEKTYKIRLPEREKTEKERALKRDPLYRVIASDRDEGANAEISYSIEEGDEHGKFFIEPKTGLVSSKKFSSAGEYDILTVSVYYRLLLLSHNCMLAFLEEKCNSFQIRKKGFYYLLKTYP